MTAFKAIKPVYFLFFIAILVLNSCVSRRNQTMFNTDPNMIAQNQAVYVMNDKGNDELFYKIKINDELVIRNLQNKEFGTNASSVAVASTNADGTANGPIFRVQDDGTVNLPALGKVLVAGLTRKEATQKIQAFFESKQLRDPIIDLSIVNLKVNVFGEVKSPGIYILDRDEITLVDIISKSGGVTKEADISTVKIIRGNKANPEIISADLTNIKSLSYQKLNLQNGDLVIVNPTKNVMATERLQSFNNIMQPIMMVVNLAILIFTITR